jgi:hypothetical protein
MKPQTAWRRRRLFGTVLALALCGVTLLLTEVGLRLLPNFLPQPQASFFSEAARIPLTNARTYGGNSILLPEVSKADILVLGDSVPFGTYVRSEEAYPACLGRLAGKSVVNLGVPSQAPPEYNRMLEVGARYQPSLVVYCIFANDFAYANLPGARELSAARTHTHLPDDRRLFVEKGDSADCLRAVRQAITNPLLSIQLLKLTAQPFQKVKHVPWRRGELCYNFASKEFWNLVSYDNPDVRAGVEANVRLCQAALRFCQSMGAKLHVILIPSKEMVYGPWVEVGPEIYDASHHRTYREFQARVRAREVPCTDLTSKLREVARDGKQLYFTIDGHFNEYGHSVVARLLQEEVMAPAPNSSGARDWERSCSPWR